MATFLGIPVRKSWIPFLWGRLCPMGCNKFMGYGFNPKKYICMICGFETPRTKTILEVI